MNEKRSTVTVMINEDITHQVKVGIKGANKEAVNTFKRLGTCFSEF